MLAISVGMILVVLSLSRVGNDCKLQISMTTLFIVLGWITTSEVAFENSKRQHTISLITQYINKESLDRRYAINEALEKTGGILILNEELKSFDEDKNPTLRKIDAELNFYEFLAIGIKQEDIDEDLASKCLRSIFDKLYRQAFHYIDFWHKKSNFHTWCYLIEMHDREQWKC